jgi:hypothetical protein
MMFSAVFSLLERRETEALELAANLSELSLDLESLLARRSPK